MKKWKISESKSQPEEKILSAGRHLARIRKNPVKVLGETMTIERASGKSKISSKDWCAEVDRKVEKANEDMERMNKGLRPKRRKNHRRRHGRGKSSTDNSQA